MEWLFRCQDLYLSEEWMSNAHFETRAEVLAWGEDVT